MFLVHDDDLWNIGGAVCLFIHKLIVPSMLALAGAWFPPARHTYGLPPKLPTKDTGTRLWESDGAFTGSR
jgi:hypothetical protein